MRSLSAIALMLCLGPLSGFAEQIFLDPGRQSFIEVREGSRYRVLSNLPKTISLAQGELFAILESESAFGHTVLVQTPHADIRFERGGVIIESVPAGTWIRVFGDSAHVDGVDVMEGFVYFIHARGEKGSLKRLQYQDYANWQPWVKKWYEKKDDHDRDNYAESFD